MRRDMDLIRTLMLRLEAIEPEPNRLSEIDPSTFAEGYTAEQVRYHYRLLHEAGLIDPGSRLLDEDELTFNRLTWPGHDFVDSVRDPGVWRKTKEGASKVGGWTIGLLADVAKAILKQKLREATGIEL